MPVGGHWAPISIPGANEEAKKAQKNLKKNITSLVMKRIIAIRSPVTTREV